MTKSFPRPMVLVVDDVPENLAITNELLRRDYVVRVVTSGAKALEMLQAGPLPDLILLDILMPDMDGYAVCREIKADPRTRHIPVIFLTALADDVDEQMGLGLGAVDFISKPINPSIMLARIGTQMALKSTADFLRDKNDFLEQEVMRRMEESDEVQDSILRMLASLAGTHGSGGADHHLWRVQQCLQILLEQLDGQPQFADLQGPEAIALTCRAAMLYDIGMARVPDEILRKPTKLGAREFEAMAVHTQRGKEAIEQIEQRLGRTVPLLELAKDMAYSHQEKWDGTGYPLGLAGENIPSCARVLAVVDAYVAMTSPRPYRPAMSHADATAFILEKGRGRRYDPVVVDAFRARESDFWAVLLQEAARRGDKAPPAG